MTALKPLIALLEQVERERDAALAQHQRSLAQLEGAQRQADQLHHYRADYAERYSPHQSQRSSTPDLLQCYHGFMDRLHVAIDQQGHALTRWRASTEQAAHILQQHELRVASVRKLIERRRQEFAHVRQRQEAHASDEHAARMGWARRHAGFSSTRL